MSERILKALMQLFAIIAKVDGVTSSSRGIVQTFLKQLLSNEQVEAYLKIFDEFLEAHHQVSKRKDGSAKRTSLNSVKVLKICTQINAELEQKQKIVVLVRLIEFIHSSNEISEQELEFVQTVAETFNVESEEFKRILGFIQSPESQVPDSASTLVVDHHKENPYQLSRHIHSEGMNGHLRVLYIDSVDMYIIMYFGTSDLLLNGQNIAPSKVYILTPGSSIRSSKVAPVYYSDILAAYLTDKTKARISFVTRNLDYKFKNGKLGLRNINITEESGKLIGIMGGSGAGKSTLLNVLNGQETPSGGAVLINGKNIHTQRREVMGVIGHVSQDDLLIEELTVFQNLFYNAKLCFGNLSDAEITEKVNKVLMDLGLFEKKDLKVGNPLEKTISGGQRKRLNIALELIREPNVLYVDEPTSGLSSRDSENIMDLLKELALKGKLLFVVIHQPSSEIFKMFDKLIILDVGGYPIYYGNPVDGVIYFKHAINHVTANISECVECGNVNPEQIFNIIETKVVDEYGGLTNNRKISPPEWNELYREKIESKIPLIEEHTEIPPATFKIPNKISQFMVFMIRDVKAKLTNTQYLVINLCEAPLLAFILAYLVRYYDTDISNTLGYIFRENANLPAYLFMSVIVALFIGLTVSAEEIIRDRKIQKRESFLNLSRSSYLLSKISIMFVLSGIQTICFVIVGNLILDIRGMYFDYWLVLFSTSCFANMLGLNISSAFNSAVTIYILIPFLLIPQLLLSGVIVKFHKLNPTITSQKNVPVTGEVMASRWAFEALAVNQFINNDFERQFYPYEKAISYADFKKNYWLSKLRAKLEGCESILNDPAKKDQLAADLQLLHDELAAETKRIKNVKFPELEMLMPGKFSSSVADGVKSYFDQINKIYIKRSNENSNEKDKIVAGKVKTEASKEEFLALKNAYENESLNDLVKNGTEMDRIIEKDGEIIQRADPIFLDPEGFKSHFFAPRKKVFGKYYDTYWVNIGVIWMMSITLAVTLYFDLLKKLLDWMGDVFSRFGKKPA
ncbi:MAG: ATP-binding cassette domain-containing protein [Bacteroidia bacterium]|nr:ATP-binding cassette domain-containing protein [Bacteroidia bacterium]